jgi:elongation factor G
MTTPPSVPLAPGHFDYCFKRPICCPGCYARVVGYLLPCEDDFLFENQVKPEEIPPEFIAACEEGFREATQRGDLAKYPVTGVKVVLTGGRYHEVDSNALSFKIAAFKAFQQAYATANLAMVG